MSDRNVCDIPNTERNTVARRSVDNEHKYIFLLSLSNAPFLKFSVGSGSAKKVSVCDVFPLTAT